MYPRDFFDTYWRPEIRDEVFVAMPFHVEFTPIWEEVIRPAVDEDIPGPLRARRVDASALSGSVITDILDGIAHSKLILADISVACEGKWLGQRNGNVMYEVGLAHAVRQTTEILLVRSDEEDINFDVAHINIHKYDRNTLQDARSTIRRLVTDLLRQIEQEKSLQVARAIGVLDADMLMYMEMGLRGPFNGPNPVNMGELLGSISTKAALSRLQQVGIVRFGATTLGSVPAFSITNFGIAVAKGLRQFEAPGQLPSRLP